MMPDVMPLLWRLNIDLSLLLLAIIALRWVVKKTSRIYDTYWLWALLPIAPLTISLAKQLGPYITPPTLLVKAFEAQLTGTQTQLHEHSPRALTGAHEYAGQQTNWYQSILEPMNVVFLIWAIICLALVIRLAKQHLALRASLRASASKSPTALTAKYPIIGIDQVGFSPAVYGLIKPKIYFPTSLINELEPHQCDLILRHEEQHVRHGHLWLNLAWDIVTCLLWFNPLIYMARRLFRHDQEVFCDSIVLKNSDWSHQRAYGHALLSTVSATHSVSLLCSWKMFDQLEERIMNIKTQHPRFNKNLVIFATALTLGVGSLYATATTAQLNKDQQTADQDEIEVDLIDKQHDGINIITIDTDAIKQTTIKVEGKVFRAENGKRFVLENGTPRELTDTEAAHFTELLRKAEQYAEAGHKEKGAIFDYDNVHAYTFENDGDIDIDEVEAKLMKLAPMAPEELEVLTIFPNADNTERRIEKALQKSEASNNTAVIKARKKLEKVQQRLAEKQQKLEQERKEAKRLLQELSDISDQA